MSAIDPRLAGQRRPGPDRKLDPIKELELVSDYRAGMKLAAMQAKHGLSKRGIYDVLERHGVPRDGRISPPSSDHSAGTQPEDQAA